MHPCKHGSMQTSPNGQGVVLLGCNDGTRYYKDNLKYIYELQQNEGKLQWKQMNQTLTYPRYKTVSMLIPDELAICDTIYTPLYLQGIIEITALKNINYENT